MVETMVASPYVSALLRFAAARFETLAETMVASPYVSALLSFAAARFEALAETITFRVTQVRCCVLHRTILALLSRGAGSFAD